MFEHQRRIELLVQHQRVRKVDVVPPSDTNCDLLILRFMIYRFFGINLYLRVEYQIIQLADEPDCPIVNW